MNFNLDPIKVSNYINDIEEDALYHDASKTIMLKNLKTLWCSQGNYDYRFLNHFLNMLSTNELTEFKQKLLAEQSVNLSYSQTIQSHRNTIPKLFMWLLNTNDYNDNNQWSVCDIIDTIGFYCIEETKQTLLTISHHIFTTETLHDKKKLYSSLKKQLIQNSLINQCPYRDDVCFRFTRTCKTIIQKIRDVV